MHARRFNNMSLGMTTTHIAHALWHAGRAIRGSSPAHSALNARRSGRLDTNCGLTLSVHMACASAASPRTSAEDQAAGKGAKPRGCGGSSPGALPERRRCERGETMFCARFVCVCVVLAQICRILVVEYPGRHACVCGASTCCMQMRRQYHQSPMHQASAAPCARAKTGAICKCSKPPLSKNTFEDKPKRCRA